MSTPGPKPMSAIRRCVSEAHLDALAAAAKIFRDASDRDHGSIQLTADPEARADLARQVAEKFGVAWKLSEIRRALEALSADDRVGDPWYWSGDDCPTSRSVVPLGKSHLSEADRAAARDRANPAADNMSGRAAEGFTDQSGGFGRPPREPENEHSDPDGHTRRAS